MLSENKPTKWTAAAVVMAIWLLLVTVAIVLIVRTFRS